MGDCSALHPECQELQAGPRKSEPVWQVPGSMAGPQGYEARKLDPWGATDPSLSQPAASSSFHCIRLCDAVHRRANNHDFILFKKIKVLSNATPANREAPGWYKDGLVPDPEITSGSLGCHPAGRQAISSSLRGHDMMLVSVCEGAGRAQALRVQRWVCWGSGAVGAGPGRITLSSHQGAQ